MLKAQIKLFKDKLHKIFAIFVESKQDERE